MKRRYTACWDDGHDVGAFDYYSEHRANSKKNVEDAYSEYHKKFGYSHKVKITDTYRCLFL